MALVRLIICRVTTTPPTTRLVFFNNTVTTDLYTLSLHDALPIFRLGVFQERRFAVGAQHHQPRQRRAHPLIDVGGQRSEEHTSELQSRRDLVCRLLLEKKKMIIHGSTHSP